MIHLYTYAYEDADEQRNNELVECRQRNLANPSLSVHLITGRPTFDEIAMRSYCESGPDDICIIANSDIYFDETLALVTDIKKGEAWCLSRWDRGDDNLLWHYDCAGSQDTWIFRGSPPIVGADFGLGIPGCDNRYAKLLADAGCKIRNPSKSIRTIHVHQSNVRRYTPEEVIPEPYLMVPTTHLKVCIVQLGRYGDILSALPVAYHWHQKGYQVDWAVHEDFKDIFDVVDYASPLVWKGSVDDINEAAAELRHMDYDHVIDCQVHQNMRPCPRLENYQREQWHRAGFDFIQIKESPLVLSRKKALGYCLTGHSSPYPHAAKMEEWIKAMFAEDFHLIDMSHRQPRFTDVLPILETLDVLISVDTSLHHLARATGTPTVVLLPDDPWHQSERMPHWLGSVTYDESLTPKGRKIISDAVDKALDTDKVSGAALASCREQ